MRLPPCPRGQRRPRCAGLYENCGQTGHVYCLEAGIPPGEAGADLCSVSEVKDLFMVFHIFVTELTRLEREALLEWIVDMRS